MYSSDSLLKEKRFCFSINPLKQVFVCVCVCVCVCVLGMLAD